MGMTPLLHGGLVALKLNSLSNAVMQEGTFMDSARDNIIKVCYYINSNISRRGAGRGGKDKTFSLGGSGVGYPPPGMLRVATEADGATQGLAKLGGFPEGTANIQGFPCPAPQVIPEISIPSAPSFPKQVPHHCSLS